MNQSASRSFGKRLRRAQVAALALAALWAVATPHAAEAALPGSAGNTIVRNTITINYKDAQGAAQAAVSASVDITVTTVAATPAVVSFTPSPGSTDGTGNTQAYTVRVRSNSNGPGAISFTTSDGSFTNIAAGSAPSVPANIFLGATVIDPSETKKNVAQSVATATSISFAVPNDGGVPTAGATSGGTTGDGVLNGLVVNDIVYLSDGTTFYGPFTVSAVTDPAVGTGATTTPGSITLTNNTGATIAFTPQAGWQIVEAKDVTVTVTQGVIPFATAQNPSSWVTTVNATMAGAAAGSGTVTTNAHTGKISIAKYVRNVTQAVTGSGPFTPPVTINGASNTFYTSGVSGKPGDVLEYLAVLTDAGTGNSTAVFATDLTPTYSTLVAGTTYGSATAGQIFAHARFNAAEADLKLDGSGGAANVAFGNATGTASGSTMTFYLGTGATSAAGGALSTGQVEYLIYQVKIN
jgi:hypothetical protein